MRYLSILTLLVITQSALAQATEPAQPATDAVLAEGPLKITITGVEGTVQARRDPGQKWERVTVGMELPEGAELRTNPKSAVRFTIPPDQTVTIDRLTTLQILRANFKDGKLNTDLGMKYGRTRFDIEAAGRAHDATVRSPNSVLAVRGTKVSLYDQPPFAPQAVSLTGRAFFRDVKKQTSIGGNGRSKITTESDTVAAESLSDTNVDPRTAFAARTTAENQLGLTLGSFSGPEYQNLTLFSQVGRPFTSVIGTLPNQSIASFRTTWINPGADVNLTVRSPLGDIVTIANTEIPSASGGFYLQNNMGQGGGTFFDDLVQWPFNAPGGRYVATATLVSGTSADVQLFAETFGPNFTNGQQFPPGEPSTLPRTTLTPQNPSITLPLDVQGVAPPPARKSSAKKAPVKTTPSKSTSGAPSRSGRAR